MIAIKPNRRQRCLPLGFDLQPPPAELVKLEGALKEALEIGRNRLVLAGMVFTLAFSVIGYRLVDLSLSRLGNEPRIAREATPAQLETGRADILDRNGMVLATTLPTASLYANPRHIANPGETANALSAILPEVSAGEIQAKLSSDTAFVWLKRNIAPRQQYAINRLGVPGLYFQREQRRFYPYGGLTSHVVGFAGVDNQGLAGIERSFDAMLRGSSKPLELSLDVRLQHILSEELSTALTEFNAIGGAGIILDAASGETLAMVSLPSYDPDNAGSAPEDARFNRATLGVYEMGSVFKIFTTAMVLDRGVLTLTDGFDTSDPIRVARFTIRDFKPKKRWLSIPEIFIYSSNIGTVHMAMEGGTAMQQDFLNSLGLLRKANIELGETTAPMLPSPWREINTMTISYGHGLAVSPVQLASAVAAVVNGGELQPATLLKRSAQDRPSGRRVLKAKTSEQMRRLMRLVVTHGTGSKAGAMGPDSLLRRRLSHGCAALPALCHDRRAERQQAELRLRHGRMGGGSDGLARGRKNWAHARRRAGIRRRSRRGREPFAVDHQGSGTGPWSCD
jgi:cell division protein FtsI (penicillin-binding protein 3)